MFIVLASQSITFAQNSSSQAIFILQDIVDNFEHGLFAGGTYEAQGNDFGGFSIVQDVAHEGSHSLLFETDEDGFSRPNIEAEDNFISLTKTFLLPIDASSFSHIAYWIRSNNNDPVRFVRMRIRTGMNQDWFQISNVKKLSEINKSEFTRVLIPLNTSGFHIPAGATIGDLANITSVAFFLIRDTDTIDQDKRSIYLDDIQFLDPPYRLSVKSNPEIEVNVESGQSAGTSGSSTISNLTTNFEISELNDGAVVSLNAEDFKDVSGSRHQFSHWTVNNDNQPDGQDPINVTMHEDTIAVAHYTLNQNSLIINARTDNGDPINNINVNGNLGQIQTIFSTSVNDAALITLTAVDKQSIDNQLFHFKQWNLNGQDQPLRQNSVSFNVNEDMTITAIYSEGDFILTVSSISSSGVAIGGSDGGTTDFILTFNNNDNVQLTASPSHTIGSNTSQFRNWILIEGNNAPERKENTSLNFNIVVDSEAIAVYEPMLETSPGWNLVSLPSELNAQAETAIASLSSTYWEWTNNNFHLAGQMTSGVGYWFFSNHVSFTPISGVIPGVKSRILVPGWNLVGVIGDQLINRPESSSIRGKIWTWNNKQKRYISIEDNFLPLHKKNKMFPGRGYWIYLNSVSNIELGSE